MPGKNNSGNNGRSKTPEENALDSKGSANGKRPEHSKHTEQEHAEQEEKRAQQEKQPESAEAADKQEDTAAAGKGRDQVHTDSEKPDQRSFADAAFPVVGIGSSAGGLEALEAFVSALPEQSGLAFVIVAHSHPKHATMLPDLLSRKSKAKIVLLEDGMKLEQDTVYVPPSDRDPVVREATIHLKQRSDRAEVHMPIDIFLKSLAENYGEAAGCVILSGTGTDGTGGLRRIKEQGGVAVVQRPDTARHTGMPNSAMETGIVDYLLSPEEMPEKLIQYFRHPATIHRPQTLKEESPDVVSQILSYLSDHTRHDFSLYKKSTLVRRIERRMGVTHCQTASEYFKYLTRHSAETQALFQDLLIGVTNFFRDPEVFAYMGEQVIPDILSRAENQETFRVWIPGCATGEEVYSVVILIKEAMEKQNLFRDVQVFATDIDPTAIGKARHGPYPQNIAVDVSPERLRRFFTKEQNAYYRVKKEIREPVVFAEQNVLRDPPFMHLDLLVCRNLLIYLEPKAQQKLLPLFHYNLKPGGVLFLGTSESTGRFSDLFEPIHKKYSIYKKRDISGNQHVQVEFPVGTKKIVPPEAPYEPEPEAGPVVPQNVEKERAVQNKLLADYSPPCVIVDNNWEIVYIHGRTGKYLEHAQGEPNLRVSEMAREGLRHVLSAALRRAGESKEQVRENGVQVRTNGDFAWVNLRVEPLHRPPLKDCHMIVFEETQAPEQKTGGKQAIQNESARLPDDEQARRIVTLERELENLREDYRSTVEELETTNEELKSSNEELYSSNEELQSTNEELESSREELESLNEELSTVNNELHNKITETEEAYGKITEVLNNTGIAIVFLDNELNVRRFTNEANRLINLIDKDVGRPIEHISHNLEYDRLIQNIRQVLKHLSPVEEEIRTRDGHWYRMRIMAHRTGKNIIEGVVLTFINIDPQKQAQNEMEKLGEKTAQSPSDQKDQ